MLRQRHFSSLAQRRARATISLNSYGVARPLVTRRFRASLQPTAITIARYIVRDHGTALPIEEQLPFKGG
jgi:hypothetical protein